MIGRAAQVDKDAGHTCNHLAIFHHGIEIGCIRQRLSQVMSDLGEAGFDRQGRVPSPTIRGVKSPRLAWFGVSETRIDELGMRHAVHQFFGAKAAMAALQASKDSLQAASRSAGVNLLWLTATVKWTRSLLMSCVVNAISGNK